MELYKPFPDICRLCVLQESGDGSGRHTGYLKVSIFKGNLGPRGLGYQKSEGQTDGSDWSVKFYHEELNLGLASFFSAPSSEEHEI